jgi:hypothetical protein
MKFLFILIALSGAASVATFAALPADAARHPRQINQHPLHQRRTTRQALPSRRRIVMRSGMPTKPRPAHMAGMIISSSCQGACNHRLRGQ